MKEFFTLHVDCDQDYVTDKRNEKVTVTNMSNTFKYQLEGVDFHLIATSEFVSVICPFSSIDHGSAFLLSKNFGLNF